MNYFNEYMDDDFVDYEMKLHTIAGNKFKFRLKLNERVEYGKSDYIVNFIIYEALFYLRNRFPEFIGNQIHIIISREYNGRYHNFVTRVVVL